MFQNSYSEGLNGQKIKDTEKVSGTKIRFKQDKNGNHKAVVFGPSKEMVTLAENLILIAIKHFKASLEELTTSDKSFSADEAAKCDIETFFFEINNLKA